MGAVESSENKPIIANEIKNTNESNKKSNLRNTLTNRVTNEDKEVFIKIINISNDILSEFNQEFLKNNFCDKMALIYKKNLSKLNINLLRIIQDEILSNKINRELLLSPQYIQKNDEKFIVDTFKGNLDELFWDHHIQFDDRVFKGKDKINNVNKNFKNIPIEDTLLKIKNVSNIYLKKKNYYIDIKHVNDLLSSKNKLSGGNPQPLNIPTPTYNNNLNSKKNDEINLNDIQLNQNNLNSFNQNNSKPFNSNKPFNQNNSNNSKPLNSNNSKSFNSNNYKPFNSNTKSFNLNNSKPFNTNNTKLFNTNNSKLQTNSNSYNQLKNVEKSISEPNVNKFIKKNIEENVNNIIIGNMNSKKFFRPKKFEMKNYCKNKEICELTKKQICESITENLIIRNNIIAAILTLIPYKNGNKYEGGLCFQKFLNLDQCKVCVPVNYSEIKKSKKFISPEKILEEVLKKADYLDEKSCNENLGKFLTLSEEQRKNLIKKLQPYKLVSQIDVESPILNNYYFLQYRTNLLNEYFSSLNALLDILLKIKEIPLINNITLQKISEDTKYIIDRLYNICHYYYVFAIISLITSDYDNNTVIEEPKIVTKTIKNLLEDGLKIKE
jgi:hypothetical protein